MSEIKEIPEIFQYTSPVVPDDCIHKISPSQIEKFFTLPKLYYLENISGGDKTFQGNTATVLGTICHYIYESVTNKTKINRESINEQLSIYNKLKPELGLDIDDIMCMYPQVTEVVVNEYLIPANNRGGLIKSELQVVTKVDNGIYLAGSMDRLEGDCIVDFKTVGTKPTNTDSIPFGYKIQLLAYAYALRKMGYEVNKIRLVYGIKPTKTLPARCIVVTEQIDYIAEKLINDTLRLIAESVIICHNRPELIYLIFKSYDLKGN